MNYTTGFAHHKTYGGLKLVVFCTIKGKQQTSVLCRSADLCSLLFCCPQKKYLRSNVSWKNIFKAYEANYTKKWLQKRLGSRCLGQVGPSQHLGKTDFPFLSLAKLKLTIERHTIPAWNSFQQVL